MLDSDSLYHRLFSHPILVEQLVRAFVPVATAIDLDFARMERVPAKFHARGGKRREGDVIWRIPTVAGLDLILYLLFEFQSKIDHWMSVRTQVYEGLLWQQLIDEKQLRSDDWLPPLLLLVLYNGDSPWEAPVATEELLAVKPDSPLWPWQPRARYYLLDMGRTGAAGPKFQDNLAALLVRLEQGHEDPAELGGLIDEVLIWFRSRPGFAELRNLFTELVRQAIAGLGPAVPAVDIPAELLEMRTMLATQGERWIKKWTEQGEARGEARGKAEMLLRLLRRRFKTLPAELEARVRAAGMDQLDEWSDRILDAQTLAAIFGPEPPH